jgi:hypothetical protein
MSEVRRKPKIGFWLVIMPFTTIVIALTVYVAAYILMVVPRYSGKDLSRIYLDEYYWPITGTRVDCQRGGSLFFTPIHILDRRMRKDTQWD